MGHIVPALRFAPLVPPWVLALLAALALVALGLALFRRARGALLRAGFALVVLGWLAGPLLVRETWRALPDIGLLVLDHSASMGVGDRAAVAARARAALLAQARRFPHLELRTVVVPERGAAGTRLFAAIRAGLAEIPRRQLAGVIALTDGQAVDTPPHLPFAAPFHVLLAAHGEQTDRVIRLLAAPRYGVVGKSVTLRLKILDLGARIGPASARLTIRRDGAPKRVESVPVGAVVSVPVPIRRTGPVVVALSVSRLPGEVSTLNNQAVVRIEGVRERLRVLLVAGEPNRGLRAWRRLLKSDPAVQLVNFTILRTPQQNDQTPLNQLALIAFPVNELFARKIGHFDLIILDSLANDGLLPPIYLANIARYVEHGGALLLNAGPEFAGAGSLADSPLGAVLPAVPVEGNAGLVVRPFRPRLSALGRRHPVTADLPGAGPPKGQPRWGQWYRMDAASALGGESLMHGPGGRPLLIINRVGKGRVALLLSDQIWLWSRGHDGGGPTAALLRRLAHWLMKEPALSGNALTATVAGGELRILRRKTLPGPPAPVTLTDPAGRSVRLALHRIAPGRWAARVAAPHPGVWRVREGSRAAFAAAAMADGPEFADLRATARRLAPLARASGGGVDWLVPGGAPTLRRTARHGAQSGAGWIGLRRNRAHLVTGIAASPLLPPWAALALLAALALAAWRREGS